MLNGCISISKIQACSLYCRRAAGSHYLNNAPISRRKKLDYQLLSIIVLLNILYYNIPYVIPRLCISAAARTAATGTITTPACNSTSGVFNENQDLFIITLYVKLSFGGMLLQLQALKEVFRILSGSTSNWSDPAITNKGKTPQ